VIRIRVPALLLATSIAACAKGTAPAPAPAPAEAPSPPAAAVDAARVPPRTLRPLALPLAPPEVAFQRGWMPLGITGVPEFAAEHPAYDGRGVLIAILDSGLDPGVPGLATASTGERKILDLRDFSAEGRVVLVPLTSRGDTVVVAGQRLAGMSRVRGLDADGPWYGGAIVELVLGDPDAADLDADGDVADTLAVVVTKATDGWVLFADLGGDGTLANDRPIHDFLVARESFGWAPAGATPYVTLAANFAEQGGEPVLDLFFDTSAHGTHVAGIAAGHDIYGVRGFDGVAPGAQLLGLKIADDAQGGVSRTGSMLRAMDYAIQFAARRQLALVLNMSFGVGNELEGTAVMDRLIDSTLALHPSVVFVISAGNEGPGISTIGFPGSASLVISVGALFPGVFLASEGDVRVPQDGIADFSSRGGEVGAPHIVTPGVAFSTVPLWNRGGERQAGTSMASPHAAGLAARLLSGAGQEGKRVTARSVRQALMVTAQPLVGATFIDQGTGVPNLRRAWAWLAQHADVPAFEVAARPGFTGAFVEERAVGPPVSARFDLGRKGGAALPLRFKGSAPWLIPPRAVTMTGDSLSVEVQFRRSQLTAPGVHVGVVSVWGPDSTVGPLARLVSTLVVPWRGDHIIRTGVVVHAGQLLRVPFIAQPARAFSVTIATASPGGALAYLHEPAGMPFRDGHTRQVGEGERAASFDVLAQDARSGVYELVVQASPFADATVDITIRQAPVAVAVRESGAGGLAAALRNLTREGVRAEVGAAAIGAARAFVLNERNSARSDLAIVAPAWARGVQVDVEMDRASWSRFTDFGVSLFDSTGRQLGKAPLNYAFGRLEHELERGELDRALRLSLFPGLASPADSLPWQARVTVRFYADSARPLVPADERTVTLGGGEVGTVRFQAADTAPRAAGYALLGLVLVRTGEDEVWAAEAVLPVEPGVGVK
jgi:subtilisin family serine protease